MESTEQEYDVRYAGDYMDVDNYSTWAHADLRTRQVIEVLENIPISPNKVLDYGCGVGRWIPILAKIFSKSNIEDLLNGAFSDSVYIEKRSEVISITYDNTTLELPGYCPPFCF